MVCVYGSKCFCTILVSDLVRVKVCVYGSKLFCGILVRRANSGMCLWVECLCEVLVSGRANSGMCLWVKMFLYNISKWFGSSRGMRLWVEIILWCISKGSE